MAYPAYSGYNFVPTLHSSIYPSIDPTLSPLSQSSKTILITGAGRGIGRSIALHYALASVACIILCARTGSELDEVEIAIKNIKRTEEIRVRKFILDVADEKEVTKVIETVRKEEGRLDVLVNNAGTSAKWVKLGESDMEDYWRAWEVNVKGVYLMMRAALPLMLETAKTTAETTTTITKTESTETANRTNGGVHVINISSIGAVLVEPTASGYQSSKLAVCRLTEFLAAEYASQGINAISVHPGGVKTELSKLGPEALQARKFPLPYSFPFPLLVQNAGKNSYNQPTQKKQT